MNHFSIRDIENLSGIKAHTLRVWEQRFNLLSPKRKAGNHRFYDNDDLKYILRIAYLYNQGYKISRIACLSEKEIHDLAVDVKHVRDNHEIFINWLMEASIDFEQERFETILRTAESTLGYEELVLKVIFPLLNKIGMLWLTGRVIPAHEHFASSFIKNQMVVAIDKLELPDPGSARKVLLFAPRNEFHELPLLFMWYLLKKNRISVVYLGINTDNETVVRYCSRQPVTELYFYIITNLVNCNMDKRVQELAESLPDKEIFFGGSQVCKLNVSPPNLTLLKTSQELLSFVNR
ncbi:MAG: MerR family transcriptional regulator [Chitinophagaceae bacterium]|nr:MAG: MerR family transcriptional regulator [Chitinophagaceae bacterium]